MAAVAAAIDSESQLYESLTLISSLNHLRLADQIAKPQPRQPIRLAQRPADQNLLVLRHQIDARLKSAKSTYASSTSSGHGSRSANSRIASRLTIVPVGLFGFGRNASFRPSAADCQTPPAATNRH